jgi:hypothetical protein
MVCAMSIRRTPDRSVFRAGPHPTFRWRLTLLFGLLFLICGGALLAISYEFFTKFAFSYPPKGAGPNGSPALDALWISPASPDTSALETKA